MSNAGVPDRKMRTVVDTNRGINRVYDFSCWVLSAAEDKRLVRGQEILRANGSCVCTCPFPFRERVQPWTVYKKGEDQ